MSRDNSSGDDIRVKGEQNFLGTGGARVDDHQKLNWNLQVGDSVQNATKGQQYNLKAYLAEGLRNYCRY